MIFAVLSKLIRAIGALAVLVACALAACGDDDPGTVTIVGTVVSFTGDPEEDGPLAVVQVCQLATPNCMTTNAEGEFTLEVPAMSEVGLTLVLPDFVDTLVADVTNEGINTVPTIAMPSNEYMEEFAIGLMTDFPLRTGLSFIRTSTVGSDPTGVAGATYALVEGTGLPYYLDDEDVPSSSLTETQESGIGGFFEMAESGKTVEVELGGAATNCRSGAAWPGSEEDRIRFPILDGFVTQATVVCDAP